MIPENSESAAPTLARALGLWDCILFVVGSIVGTGIFLSVGQVARKVPHPGWILLAWVLGGVHALAAGFTYAELGARRPAAGGAYTYLSEAFGALPAFLYNWAFSFVIQTCSVAALSVGFAEYLSVFVPVLGTKVLAFRGLGVDVSEGQLVAMAVAFGLSAWNAVGIKEGGRLNDVLTVIKIGSVLAFVFFGLIAAGARVPSFTASGQITLGAFGGALAGILWSYDGWINISALGAEVKNPKRDIPGGLVVGIGIVAFLYLTANAVYVTALPVKALGDAPRAAEAVMSTLYGPRASLWISAAVLISVLGSLSANIVPGPRVLYATAEDGQVPRVFARIHPVHRTPAFGLMFQAVLGAAMVLTGTFDQLVSTIAFWGTIFYALGGATIFVYRKRNPDAPYRCPGYPFTPILYVSASALFALSILFDAPLDAAKGAAVMAVGIGLYLIQRKRSSA